MRTAVAPNDQRYSYLRLASPGGRDCSHELVTSEAICYRQSSVKVPRPVRDRARVGLLIRRKRRC